MQKLLFDDDFKSNDKSLSEQVRNDNYKELVTDESRLCRTQKLVYDTLATNGVLCDKQIVEILNNQGTPLPLSSVLGRRNELVKMGLVEADSELIEYPDYTGCVRLNTAWRLTNGKY